MIRPITRIAMIVILATVAFPGYSLAASRCDAPGISSKYDWMFKVAARRWMTPAFRGDWCVLKAICYIESRLDPNAKSWVGAVGLCQIMRATAASLRARHGLERGSLRDYRYNIKASALLLNADWHFWSSPRPTFECKVEVVIAAYNTGSPNVAKAQRKAHGALCWERIRAALSQVTGKHARETINYVSRWWAAYRQLRGWTIGP